MTHIPLHHPTYAPTDLREVRKQLKDAATLAYTMFAFAATVAAQRMLKLPDGVVPGFRASFVNAKLKAAGHKGALVGGVPRKAERRRAQQMIKKHWIDVRKNEAEAAKHAN